MQNDQHSKLSSLADTIYVPSSDNAASAQQPTAGFTPKDLQELRQQLDEDMKNSSKSRQELEVEETAWSSEDSLAAAQKFFSSAALGWAEIVTGKPAVGC